jgi:hypothetical protein
MGVKKANTKQPKGKPKRKTPSRSTQSSANRKKEYALRLLDELAGMGQGIWEEDAQKYVNRLRDNDRF